MNNADVSGATNYTPAGPLQIDTTAPVVTISNTGGPTNQATQTLTGTVDMADAGSTVKVFDGTTQVATDLRSPRPAVGAPMSPWQAAPVALTAQDTDAAGNTGTSNAVVYTLNTTVPVVTSITTSGAGITNGVGDLNAGKLVTLTVDLQRGCECSTPGLAHALPQRWGKSASLQQRVRHELRSPSTTRWRQVKTPPTLTVTSLNIPPGSEHPGCGIETMPMCRARPITPRPGSLQIDTTAPVVTISNTGGPTNQATQTLTGTVDMAMRARRGRRSTARRRSRRRRSPRPAVGAPMSPWQKWLQ